MRTICVDFSKAISVIITNRARTCRWIKTRRNVAPFNRTSRAESFRLHRSVDFTIDTSDAPHRQSTRVRCVDDSYDRESGGYLQDGARSNSHGYELILTAVSGPGHSRHPDILAIICLLHFPFAAADAIMAKD